MQMIEELQALPDPDGVADSLLDSIDLIVPHQANKTMVDQLAQNAGLSADSLYFNIEQVGNTSSASIPLAIHDAVRDGVITEPVRDLRARGSAPGAVAGYTRDAHRPGRRRRSPRPTRPPQQRFPPPPARKPRASSSPTTCGSRSVSSGLPRRAPWR